ncbi:substrate-binding domain-containing protein [Streptosporangium sp. NPDC050855]|uniref:substrate-binding domain-containing protein n=1 Tax=Streptosporangium sp. NPDC050855 TaxID=3366194 RepID=UPI0037A22493
MRRRPRAFAGLVACAMLIAGTGCAPDEPDTKLRVLASSELADLRPLLDELRRDTGIEVVLDHRGTVDASVSLAKGDDDHDLAWLSDDRYLQLKLQEPGRRLRPLSTEIMMSPVVVGVRPRTAERLRRNAPDPKLSWADIADGAAEGLVRFGMADPRHANSGLAALVGVATAAAGTGGALRPQDVTCDRLRGLFSGRTLTAASSAGLVDAFVADQGKADALIEYESTILSLNASGRLREPLEIVYPEDGIVLSKYPLLLFNPARRAAYDKVVAWLTRADTQRKIMQRTLRRPVDPGVTRDPRLRTEIGNALYYPDRPEVVDRLLAGYDPSARSAGQVIFVLDYSGSMRRKRIKALRSTFEGLSGDDDSSVGRFVRFYRGERFILMRFGGDVRAERGFTIAGPHDVDAIRAFLATDRFDRRTAVWSALDHAYGRAGELRRADPERPVTIVLMTDGLNNAGIGPKEFLSRYRALPPETRAVHTYAIRFGEADPAELDRVAKATGGRMVDADASSLDRAFKETRGCR